MIERNDPKQMVEALRLVADKIKAELGDDGDVWLHACRKWMLAEADRIDPPYKLDRSLRGWVMVTEPFKIMWVWKAYESGLADRADTMTWGEVEKRGWRVEKLNVLQPGHVAVPVSKWENDMEAQDD